MEIIFKIVALFSRLPLRVLYILSDIIFFFMYHVVGYRKEVVFLNLRNSFPDLPEDEIKNIRKKFYRNFSDYLVETLKSFTVSADELKYRVQHINRELFYDAHQNSKNVILLTGHVFNWEWFTALATMIPQKSCHPVYRKMQNEFWDSKIKKIRNAHGNSSLEANEVIKHIFRNTNDGNSVYMFVADQSPNHLHVEMGTTFLNQMTPVFIGYDKLATRMDLDFLYCDMKKIKRGHYQVNYYKIQPDGDKFVEFEVVKKFHQLLEKTIEKAPDNYLWSHRRWKYVNNIKKIF